MIRPMRFGDYPYVLALIEKGAACGDLLPRDEGHLRRHEPEFVVAVENNHVGGVASLHIYSRRLAEVLAFAVSPAFAKKGYGTLLLRECQRRAQAAGVALVMITASAQWAPFLKKLGFRAATAHERYGLFFTVGPNTSGYDRNMIRPAQPNDYPTLSRLINDAAARGDLLPRLAEEIAAHGGEFFVALGGGSAGPIVGCAALEIYQPDLPQHPPELAEIRSLAVHQNWRDQNYGRHLVLACLARARTERVPEVLVVTGQMNFFRALGFRTATRRSGQVGLGGGFAYFWQP